MKKKPYMPVAYEVTHYTVQSILTLSSDRENAYVPSEDIWGDKWNDFDDFDD